MGYVRRHRLLYNGEFLLWSLTFTELMPQQHSGHLNIRTSWRASARWLSAEGGLGERQFSVDMLPESFHYGLIFIEGRKQTGSVAV